MVRRRFDVYSFSAIILFVIDIKQLCLYENACYNILFMISSIHNNQAGDFVSLNL